MTPCTAEEIRERLTEGNKKYVAARSASIDTSVEILETGVLEQKPYAIIITCSDSRIIPQAIFSTGTGELFVIRIAGNVVDDHCLGSIEYANKHLGTGLAVVLGHDHCGAVDSALHHHNEGYVKCITDEILRAVGDEKDEEKACILNIENSCRVIREKLAGSELTVVGAVYRLESGQVEFL